MHSRITSSIYTIFIPITAQHTHIPIDDKKIVRS